MRYEFEVGDYVETIANESRSSHPIGYIGKITRIDIFPKVELANTSIINKYVTIRYWANLDEHPSGWSDISEIKISTKEAYEAYHKPKLPEYVECIYNEGTLSNELILGKIYKVDLIKSTDNDLWLIGFGTGIYRGLNPPASTNYSEYSGFKFSSKEAFDTQNKPQPKTKVLCGYKVVKPEGSSIISIGCKSISRGEIQGFLNVCDKFNITGVYSEFVKGQSIGLDAIKEALK